MEVAEELKEYTASDLLNGDGKGGDEQDARGEAKVSVNVDIAKVKDFLLNVVDSTEIAEINLQMGDMELYVLRKMDASPPAPAPVAAAPAAPTSAPAAAPAAWRAEPEQSEDESIDESAVVLTSETVGTFRRGRYAKGGKKIGKGPMVDTGDVVKKGQTVAFVEQMGTFTPVLAKQAGEISKFEIEEGDPVGYGQPLVSFFPFFGGHIIGESKHV